MIYNQTMTKVALPKGCYGVEFPGGQKFNANKRGVVDVPDKLAKQIKTSTVGEGNLGVISSLERQGLGHNIEGGRACPTCAFRGFKWQKTCPRDGTLMEVEQ